MRDEPDVLAGSIDSIVGVLDDARTIVTRPGAHDSVYVVLDPQGKELVRFPPPNMFSGTISVAPFATSLAGNTAYVALRRTYAMGTSKEIVVYRIDESSAFRAMRRVVVSDFGFAQLVISDGTVFVWHPVQAAAGVTAYLPDNTSVEAYTSSSASLVQATTLAALAVGPLSE